jgi:glycine/D-amino acid oxidase-like deaminating enzyme
MQVDYIIIGQGICGTFLSWELHRAGQKVLVIDEPQPFSASKVASGVINPVTGRQVVTTWMAKELMPFTWGAYKTLGKDIGETVIENCTIYAFPPSQQMREAYEEKIKEGPGYVHPLALLDIQDYTNLFHYFHGAVEIDPVWLVHLHRLLKGWRQQLAAQNALLEEPFEAAQLEIREHSVTYKGIQAKKLFFCNGVNSFDHPLWEKLPYSCNKGEALIVDIPALPKQHIYKFGITTLVPWYDGLWWVGSSYENRYEDALPSPGFRNKKMAELENLLKCDFSVVDHIASIRPATVERRPFVGLHPKHPAVGILNGMGTKGCSLAPYFALQLAEHLLEGKPVLPAASINRFTTSLSLP